MICCVDIRPSTGLANLNEPVLPKYLSAKSDSETFLEPARVDLLGFSKSLGLNKSFTGSDAFIHPH